MAKFIWYDNLYGTDYAGAKLKRLLKSVDKGKYPPNLYMITLPFGDSNMLEIVRALEFKQKVYEDAQIYVVGLAKSKDSASEIVTSFVEEMYNSTGKFDVRSYLNFGN